MNKGEVKYYDNVLTMDDRHRIFDYCMGEQYALGWKDDTYTPEVFFHKHITGTAVEDQLDGYFRNAFREDIEGYKLVQTIINCGVPGAVNRPHRDQWALSPPGSKLVTCLYMVNMNWDMAWGGELKFWDDHSTDVRAVSNYIPGRVIAFDGALNHCAATYAYRADYFRFTIASWYVDHD